MNKQTTLYFKDGKLKFSAGHFTIFSATEREPLHGHNYTLEIILTAEMGEAGITFDYRLFEDKLLQLCRQLHLRTLIPSHSPYLMLKEEDQHVHLTFNHTWMSLLKSDVVILPLTNISLEELSQWFVDQLKQDQLFLSHYKIKKIIIKVCNNPFHGGEAVLEL